MIDKLEKPFFWRARLCAAVVVLAARFAVAYPASDPPPPIIQQNYDNSRRDYNAKPDDDALACKFAAACFDLADFARDSAERAKLANEGIAASRGVVARQSQSGPGHYYLGLNLAQLARTKSWAALGIVNEMDNELKLAVQLDPKIDHGGPDRFLGLLYRDAPGWPISVGSRNKARRHLEHALTLDPNFPDNLLNLAESEYTWNEHSASADHLEQLRGILSEARKKFSGPYWEPSWKDWDHRIEQLQENLGRKSRNPVHKR